MGITKLASEGTNLVERLEKWRLTKEGSERKRLKEEDLGRR